MHQLLPGGLETSEGADAVALIALAGLVLDDWQSWFLDQSLRKQQNGQWSAFEVGLIMPRQNGKGALLEARQLAGLFLTRDPLQVHSAHEFKTAFEHFLRIVGLIESCPDLDRRVMRVRRGAGEQSIELKDGCRLRFLCRSTGSGRGLTGDTIYLDEAFALTTAMMGALLPTLSAVPNPQVWYASSAPRMSSEVLHSVRQRGRGGSTPRLLFAEWGLEPDADPEDRDNWYRVNPALGERISEEFVRAELEVMRSMPSEFARERLGIAETPADEVDIIPNWADLADTESRIVSHHCLALDVSLDRRFASFGAAGRRADGLFHVEAVECRPRTDWVFEVALKSWSLRHLPLRIQTGSPAASFIDPLREAGVEVVEVSPAEHAQAVGQFLDAAVAGTVRHPASAAAPQGSTYLLSAVRGAELRASGDVNLWARRRMKVNITPLVAVTLALGGVPTGAPSTYEQHGMEVFG